MLTGTAYSASDGDDIRNIAARFVKDPKQLVNKMAVERPTRSICASASPRCRATSSRSSASTGRTPATTAPSSSDSPRGVDALTSVTKSCCPPPMGCGLRGVPTNGRRERERNELIPPSATGTGFNVLNQSQLGGQTNNNLFAGVRTRQLNLNALIERSTITGS